ncbi:peptidase domain-containing ABC transporter [Chimaeribacter arupi]|uniref:peptidase domain-containing ABC transporter n=1 Tax=Chimaeribacter arupi TaxID=2060066 RepID=UPI0029464AE4|nr:peptidase domain-containing ABC transporter [Chimaeribacter arupi]MDV5139304.1 peptidase domain-containing ABC transporter [Chimaeribacter arupi]
MSSEFEPYNLRLSGALAYIARNHSAKIEIREGDSEIKLAEYNKHDVEHDAQIKNYFLSLGMLVSTVQFSRPDDLLNESMPLLLLTADMQWLICVGCVDNKLKLVNNTNDICQVEADPDALKKMSAFTLQPTSDVAESIRIGQILKNGLKNNKLFYSKYFISSLFMAIFALTIPVFSNLYYDKLVPSASNASLFGVAGVVVTFLIFEFLLRSSRDIYQSIVSRREDIDIDVSFFEALLYGDKKHTSLSSAFILWTEFQKIKPVLLNSLFQRVADIPLFIIFIVVIYINLGALVVIPIIIMIISLLLAYANYRYTNILMERVKEGQSNRNMFITETLYALKMIHTLNNRNLMQDWVNNADQQSWLSLQIRKVNVYYQSALSTLSNLNQILLMLFAFFLVTKGDITTGAIVSSVIVSGRMSGIISGFSSTLLSVFTTNKTINDLLKMFVAAEPASRQVLQSLSQCEGHLSLKGVSYQYDPQLPVVIENLSLDIPAGQRVAIIGECGSGKSSLMSLLSGFSAPLQGSIMYDGYNTQQLAQHFFSRFISVITTQDALFTGTIESNFALKSGEDRKKTVQALNVTNCGFVLQHPMGLRYPVSFMARNLSSGQNQQLLLARSLSSDASVFLWDEPTSCLDEQTEQRIFDNLDHFVTGKTLLMVTHRRYLLKYFDRVLVMKNGKIIRDCTPDKLLVQATPADTQKAQPVRISVPGRVSKPEPGQ